MAILLQLEEKEEKKLEQEEEGVVERKEKEGRKRQKKKKKKQWKECGVDRLGEKKKEKNEMNLVYLDLRYFGSIF
jgi:hypothetical protein